MENKEYTRITLEQSDVKVVWEVPYEDVDGEKFIDAMNTLMIGATFNQETVFRCMAQWLQENSFGRFKIVEQKDGEDDGLA